MDFKPKINIYESDYFRFYQHRKWLEITTFILTIRKKPNQLKINDFLKPIRKQVTGQTAFSKPTESGAFRERAHLIFAYLEQKLPVRITSLVRIGNCQRPCIDREGEKLLEAAVRGDPHVF